MKHENIELTTSTPSLADVEVMRVRVVANEVARQILMSDTLNPGLLENSQLLLDLAKMTEELMLTNLSTGPVAADIPIM